MAEARERLLLQAEALGFKEGASSVDVLTEAQQRLIAVSEQLQAVRTGGGSLEDVAKLTAEQEKLSYVVGQLAPQFDDLSAKQSDYIGLLSRIDPALGNMAQGFVRGIRVAGELGDAQIDLTKVTEFAREAVGKYSNALLLLGAGAAVAFGISQITAALEAERAALAKVNAEMERNRDLRQEAVEAARAQQDSIEKISDRRKDGGLSGEESEKAQGLADRLSKRFPDIDKASINQAVGNLFDTGASEDEIIDAALLVDRRGFQFREGAGGERSRRSAASRARRDRARLDEIRAREEFTLGDAAKAAEDNEFDVPRFLERLPGGLLQGQDKERIAKIIEGIKAGVGQEEGEGFFDLINPSRIGETLGDIARGQSNQQARLEGTARGLGREGFISDATPAEIRTAETALQLLNRSIERLNQNIERMPAGVTQNNGKYYGPDAGSREERKNGSRQRAAVLEP